MRHILRTFLIIPILTLTLIFCSEAPVRSEYSIGHPEYPKLTSRALGMGGATVAWIDDGTSIFHNPAGMGRIRNLTISHAHSRNHFPGDNSNLDQLDSDPTSFIIPLNGAFFGLPVGSAGAGWILQGELGYDYRIQNDNIEPYPQERLFGMGPGDRREGAGFHLWPGGYLGYTHRTNEYLYTSENDLPDGVTWRRTGEGFSAGVQQTIISGIQYGAVYEQIDSDYLPYRDNIKSERTKSLTQGWCVKPTAWLIITKDYENLNLKEWPSDDNTEASVTKSIRTYSGVEIKLGPLLMFRWGSFDGHPTNGWSYKIGPWRSDSAWVDGMMHEMLGGFPDSTDDYHPTGFNFGA